MKTIGIIAEFNPFHNGHEILIKKAKENGADRTVVVMSGNFVQRADAAILPYPYRVGAALGCGADLVLLLPVAYATGNAQTFARAAVDILDSLGCIDELVFGSECGSIEAIEKTAELLTSRKLGPLIAQELEKGESFARARENALRRLDENCADVITKPNNILATEYVAALKKRGSKIKPVTFAREGADHNDTEARGNIACATKIREDMLSGEDSDRFMPKNALEFVRKAQENLDAPVSIKKLEEAILYKLRTTDPEEIALAPDISEGIENRIAAAAKKAVSLEELYSQAKTKRYSHARIRRIVLSVFLGITAADAAANPPYIKVLGFNKAGASILKKMKATAKKPIVTKARDIAALGEDAHRCFGLEVKACDVYALALPTAKPCSSEIDFKVISFDKRSPVSTEV